MSLRGWEMSGSCLCLSFCSKVWPQIAGWWLLESACPWHGNALISSWCRMRKLHKASWDERIVKIMSSTSLMSLLLFFNVFWLCLAKAAEFTNPKPCYCHSSLPACSLQRFSQHFPPFFPALCLCCFCLFSLLLSLLSLLLLSAAPHCASVTPFVVSLGPVRAPLLLQPPLLLLAEHPSHPTLLSSIRSAVHSCCPSPHLHHSRCCCCCCCCSKNSFDQLHFQTMRLWPLSPGRRFHSQTRLTGRSFSWYSACFLLPLLLLKSLYIELTAHAPG